MNLLWILLFGPGHQFLVGQDGSLTTARVEFGRGGADTAGCNLSPLESPINKVTVIFQTAE